MLYSRCLKRSFPFGAARAHSGLVRQHPGDKDSATPPEPGAFLPPRAFGWLCKHLATESLGFRVIGFLRLLDVLVFRVWVLVSGSPKWSGDVLANLIRMRTPVLQERVHRNPSNPALLAGPDASATTSSRRAYIEVVCEGYAPWRSLALPLQVRCLLLI